MAPELPILNIHTPSSSFAIVQSLSQDTLPELFDKLSRKVYDEYYGKRVGPGWLKYEFNDSVWTLDDDSDYTIFVWRQQQSTEHAEEPGPSTRIPTTATPSIGPILHLHDPNQPLPEAPSYMNPSYYVYKARQHALRTPSPSVRSRKTKASKRSTAASDENHGIPTFKKDFDRFHSENGVRTVIGKIGPVSNVRMLLKEGYRHVYISRKFAQKHGFIPNDTTPGHYGYSGLVNIGTWPITLTNTSVATPASSTIISPSHKGEATLPGSASTGSLRERSKSTNNSPGQQPVQLTVYLSEEAHFDVVLGRSFFERRQIRTSTVDPTDVVCLDTGEKIECELVILKDGRGEIVTVT